MAFSELIQGYLIQARDLLLLAIGFFLLAVLVKGGRAVSDGKASAAETKNNVMLFIVETLTVAPYMTLAYVAVHTWAQQLGWVHAAADIWTKIGSVGTFALGILICDFIAYCSHRLYHTAWLWPAHAIHHSDTHLTWFSLLRQHPFERFRTLIDLTVLVLIGLPDWTILSVAMVRTYWGYFIHADLPWTLGPLSWVLVSPHMHKWHHALESRGSGVNFGIVFSVFDRAFGTYYVPSHSPVATGVQEPIAPGLAGQYLHPFKAWFSALTTPAAKPVASL